MSQERYRQSGEKKQVGNLAVMNRKNCNCSVAHVLLLSEIDERSVALVEAALVAVGTPSDSMELEACTRLERTCADETEHVAALEDAVELTVPARLLRFTGDVVSISVEAYRSRKRARKSCVSVRPCVEGLLAKVKSEPRREGGPGGPESHQKTRVS